MPGRWMAPLTRPGYTVHPMIPNPRMEELQDLLRGCLLPATMGEREGGGCADLTTPLAGPRATMTTLHATDVSQQLLQSGAVTFAFHY